MCPEIFCCIYFDTYFFPIFLFLTENVDKGVTCQLELDEAKVKQFKDAIENNYWLEFFVGMFWAVFSDVFLMWVKALGVYFYSISVCLGFC